MINRAAIKNTLLPGLKTVFWDYNTYQDTWKRIYDTYYSDKDQERDQEMKMFGYAGVKPEGSPYLQDTAGQRYLTIYWHKTLALSFTVTAEAMEDNLYKSEFNLNAEGLKHSMRVTKEVMAYTLFNNAINTAYPLGDGQPLLSANHPVDNGVVSNLVSSTDLNESTLETAITLGRQFVDAAGLPIMVNFTKIVAGLKNEFTLRRLLGSPYRPDTGNNDINPLRKTDVNGATQSTFFPDGYVVSPYITAQNSWFCLTDCPNSFKHFIRVPLQTGIQTDMITDNLITKARERYSFGCSNFRGVVGVWAA